MLVSVLVALVCLSAGSCSVVLMKHVPSDHPPDDYPDCSSAFTMPLSDAVLTVLGGATAVNLHSAASNPENEDTSFRTYAWVTTAVALGFLGSATYGAVQRNRCIRAKLRSGVFSQTKASPNRKHPGSLGGACRGDGNCDGELICDAPMKTCVQISPSDETLPTPEN